MTETATRETVQLKNGNEEFKPLVAGTMVSLRQLYNEKPIAIYELAMLCRDPDHEILNKVIAQDLHDLGLIDAVAAVHDSIRNIVLSAVEGDGLDMVLGNPVRP